MDSAMEDSPPPLSKNKLKKLKRDQEWEANRDKRKAQRKEKQKEKRLRNRAVREDAALQASAATNGVESIENQNRTEPGRHHRPRAVQLPITLLIDCGFDDLMEDAERISLGSQITRCYSDNNHAPYKTHLLVSSFGGHLKERFDNLLEGHHRSWKGVRFLEGDFVEAVSQAGNRMREPDGGKLAGALAPAVSDDQITIASEQTKAGEVIYLTSDSPNTLSSLSPYSTYIIGGIVDKNRHKGICYKRAMDCNIKTAKLPIGDYMQMSTRAVLATNHVVEIMLRWLEYGDWGEAFLKVMPKRKGGVLRGHKDAGDAEKEGNRSIGNRKDEPDCMSQGEKRKFDPKEGEGESTATNTCERCGGPIECGNKTSSNNNAADAPLDVGAEVTDGAADVAVTDNPQMIVGEAVSEQETGQPNKVLGHEDVP